MRFSLSNILACFQKYINKIVVEKVDIFIVVYLNDILIYIDDQRQLYAKAMH